MKSQYAAATAADKSLQSCPTLCDPIDGGPLGSPVPGILQARTLEWAAISFSSAWKWKVKVMSLSRAWLLATPWTAAHQAPPSMGSSRQEYWSGVPWIQILALTPPIHVTSDKTPILPESYHLHLMVPGQLHKCPEDQTTKCTCSLSPKEEKLTFVTEEKVTTYRESFLPFKERIKSIKAIANLCTQQGI